MNFRINTLLFLQLICLALFSQEKFEPGYILKAGNDTVWGEIKINTLADNAYFCEFKAKGANDFEVLNPDEIFEYRMEDGKYYVAKEIQVTDSTEHLFLEYLVNGIVSLYFIRYNNSDYYFLEKDGKMIKLSNDEIIATDNSGTTYSKNSNQYRGVLIYSMNDVPEMRNKINYTNFDAKSLIKTTKVYHGLVCDDFDCIDYSRSTKSKFSIDPTVGVSLSWMGLNGSDEKASDLAPYIGVKLRFYPFNALSFVSGIRVRQNRFDEYFTNNVTMNHEAKMLRIRKKSTMFTIPALGCYSFDFKKSHFLFQGGVSANFSLFSTAEFIKVYGTIPGISHEGLPYETFSRKFQVGFIVGTGFGIMINDNQLDINVLYEYNTSAMKSGYFDDETFMHTLNIGASYAFMFHSK